MCARETAVLHSAGPPEEEPYRPRRLAPEEESYTESVLVVAEDAPETTETARRKAPAAPLLTVC